MKKFNQTNAKQIGKDLQINWQEINLGEFTRGLNVELEHGSKDPQTNVTNNDGRLTGEIAWAHLKEFPDYYTRLDNMEKVAKKHFKKVDYKQ
jgi:hypothetical protein